MTMDRRQFLRSATAGLVAGASLPVALVAAADATSVGPGSAFARPDLLTVLGAERVRAIGAWYRRTTPTEADVGALLAALGARERADERALVRRDFADERTVLVDGWLLSITEARQCALFSLLHA